MDEGGAKMNKTELWVDKKRFKYIIYPLMIAGAISGLVLGVFIGESVGERIASALVGAIVGGLSIPIIIALLAMCVEVLVVWIKARKAKGDAYHMIEYGRIYPEQFQKVISALERRNDREARHLVDDLYELERCGER